MRLLLASALVLAWLPAAAPAQPAALAGVYTYDEAASDDIHAAIEAAIRGMNFIVRPIARSRLRKTNEPLGRVLLSFTATHAAIAINDDPPIRTPLDGTPIRWERADGEAFDVSTAWASGRLRQTFVAEDGRRANAYSLGPDGRTLTISVTVSSPRLPRPLTYRMTFKPAVATAGLRSRGAGAR